MNKLEFYDSLSYQQNVSITDKITQQKKRIPL